MSSHHTRIVETGNTRFIENGENSGSQEPRNVEIQKVRVQVPLSLSSSKVIVPPIVEQLNNGQDQQMNEQATHNEDNVNKPTVDEIQEIALRRSAISDDYVVYLQESKFDLGIDKDPILFSQAMKVLILLNGLML